ncbi:hypothetical protein [Spirillospora sp. CA-294931]|uniref:hypothetical protein n=1 Tax=Spirillospora sp. CA-294931 TaxID=3240042 RepID=UPI003D92DFD6
MLVHSTRGAVYPHPAADLARLAAAPRIEDGRDLPLPTVGPFGAELGTGFGAALAEAAAMRTAAAGVWRGRRRVNA